MVRITRRLAALLGVAVTLAACNPLDFFSRSVFPADLVRREAWADLSRVIPAGSGRAFDATLVESATASCIVLLSTDRSWDPDGAQVHLVVLDGNLDTLATFTMQELDGMDVPPFGGGGVMIDPVGNLAVGNRLFSMASGAPVFSSTLPEPVKDQSLALPDLGKAIMGMRVEKDATLLSQQLRYRVYDSSWKPIGSPSILFGPDTSYKVIRALVAPLVDPAAPGDVFVLAEASWTGSRSMLKLPRAAVAGGTLSPDGFNIYRLFGMLRDPAGTTTVPLDTFAPSTLSLTDSGFVAARNGSPGYDLLLIDLVADTTSPTGPVGIISQTLTMEGDFLQFRHLYGSTGGWYVYDRDARTVARYPRWWNQP